MRDSAGVLSARRIWRTLLAMDLGEVSLVLLVSLPCGAALGVAVRHGEITVTVALTVPVGVERSGDLSGELDVCGSQVPVSGDGEPRPAAVRCW